MNSSWNTLSTIVLLALHNSKIDETSKLWWSLSIVTEDFENNESAMKIQGKCDTQKHLFSFTLFSN